MDRPLMRSLNLFRAANVWLRFTYGMCLAMALLLTGHPALAGSVSYSYDTLGRVSAVIYNNGSSTTTITYTYDAAGNRTSVATTSP